MKTKPKQRRPRVHRGPAAPVVVVRCAKCGGHHVGLECLVRRAA